MNLILNSGSIHLFICICATTYDAQLLWILWSAKSVILKVPEKALYFLEKFKIISLKTSENVLSRNYIKLINRSFQ